MSSMFREAPKYQQYFGTGWDTSNVTDMSWMFYGSIFNKDLSDWEVHNVKHMNSMFELNTEYNRLSEWNASNVLDMSSIFKVNSK